jgi:type II secretion system (T2SS) protein M
MTARDRKALRVGGAVALAAFLLLRILPWGARGTARALGDLRQRAGLLAHARAELAGAAELRDSGAVLSRALVALAPRLLSGATAAEAAADLSGRLNLAAGRNQAKVERLDPVPDSAAAGRLRRARLHAAIETDVRGLVAFLRSVELGDAALTVMDLRVVAPDPTAERGPEILEVEVTVSGWYLEGAGGGGDR